MQRSFTDIFLIPILYGPECIYAQSDQGIRCSVSEKSFGPQTLCQLVAPMFIFLSCVRLDIRSRILFGPEIAAENMLISSRCGGNMGATGI